MLSDYAYYTSNVSADCTAWLDWCHTSWTCGTQYEEDIYFAGPVPPCPAPPPNYQPPSQPGVCQYNVSAARCQFMANSTSEYYHNNVMCFEYCYRQSTTISFNSHGVVSWHVHVYTCIYFTQFMCT